MRIVWTAFVLTMVQCWTPQCRSPAIVFQKCNTIYMLNNDDQNHPLYRKYPYSRNYYEKQLKRLNSQNKTEQIIELIQNNQKEEEDDEEEEDAKFEPFLIDKPILKKSRRKKHEELKIFIDKRTISFEDINGDNKQSYSNGKKKRSENFEVLTDYPVTFKDIGGYEQIKEELRQCIDILTHYKKYEHFNVRVPKGLILEGPPGNGKTLLAKGLAGEARVNFISVSGSQFQEKYVGVGSSRVRELFDLATKHIPCIIFIDEIDAVGRTRSRDGESSSSERDNTLNELLIGLDGFKNTNGVFLIGATNRLDLLDPALTRPGRIDKSIYIGLPNTNARDFIIRIHIRGKPYNQQTILIKELVELTRGLSGAQIENLLNEAMLMSLRDNRTMIEYEDIDQVLNRILTGWQSSQHEFTEKMIHHIAVHEFGHVVVGLLCKNHSRIRKVAINLASPKSPAYTVFEGEEATIYTKQTLFEHLMILLAGRIAEYEIFGGSFVSTGASNDFEEATKLAEKMVMYYGMGRFSIYPSMSETYKELIDKDVFELVNEAYHCAEFIIRSSKNFILKGATLLREKRVIYLDELEIMYHSL